MKAPKCRSCGEMHWGSAPCSAAFVADTPTVARVRLRDAVAKVPAKKVPKAKAVAKPVDAPVAKPHVAKPNKGGRPRVNPDRAMSASERMKRTREGRRMEAELLAALKALLGLSSESVGMSYGERVDLAKAAIAKAEGGK